MEKNFLEDLIWMSTRYCIGRHTIASHCHAGNIIRHAYDYMDDNFKKTLARDIRNMINDQVKFYDNIKLENVYVFDNLDSDAVYMIGNFIYITEIKYINEYKYVVDFEKKSVSACGLNEPKNIGEIIDDLLVWSKMANFLDPTTHVKIEVNDNGETKTITAFPYIERIYGKEIQYQRLYCDLESYKANPDQNIFINPDCIKLIIK